MNAKAKGTAGELAIIKKLEAEGWECYKSAASAGTFDVIALKAGDGTGPGQIKLVQVKRFGDRRGYGRSTLIESLKGWTGYAWVSAWLAERQDGQREWSWTEAKRSE